MPLSVEPQEQEGHRRLSGFARFLAHIALGNDGTSVAIQSNPQLVMKVKRFPAPSDA